ncbi:MAG TPA: DUF4352 domain-containing protein [Thermomicrobiales bacterium]|jgi:hypothetical protein|nr:DUF4352 domain-containing protein [Thermomicrobiales bacterium]
MKQRTLPRSLTSLALVLALTLAVLTAGVGPALAGQGTPEAGTPVAGGTPAAGGSVTIFDESDLETESATLSVDEIIDPFEDYDEYGAPERGERYVAVGVTVENLIPNDSIDPPVWYLTLQDTDGASYTSTYVFLPEDTDYPELSTDPILGGESASGYVFFLLPEDAEVAGIYYISSYQYLLIEAVNEAAAVPDLGEPVAAADEEGNEFVSAAVVEYLDSVDDYAEYYAPESGFRYVGVTVEIENLVENDGLDVNPFDFTVVTEDGFLFSSTYFEAEDEDAYTILESTRLRGGETIEGTVFFVVPEDAVITGILFQPGYITTVNLGNPSA